MEPDSTLLVAFLLLLAAASVFAAIRYQHLAIRIAGGVVGLLLALISGVTMVNVYYGYYQSWGALSADLTNSYSHFATPKTHRQTRAHAGHGEIQHVTLAGKRSGISREAYVYLPPQYFGR